MAFTGNFTCNSFKSGLIDGDFDFDTDTFKIALYTNSASLNAETAAYTTSGEVVWFRLHGWWEYPNSLQGHHRRYGVYYIYRHFMVCRYYGSWCVDLQGQRGGSLRIRLWVRQDLHDNLLG
jgi:hypothetical protein